MDFNYTIPPNRWRYEYNSLVKKLVSCKNLFEIKDVTKEINTFIRKYEIRENTKEFKKLSDLLSLMKLKVRNEFRLHKESVGKKVIRITESDLNNIIKQTILAYYTN
jgi:hypothetical protein